MRVSLPHKRCFSEQTSSSRSKPSRAISELVTCIRRANANLLFEFISRFVCHLIMLLGRSIFDRDELVVKHDDGARTQRELKELSTITHKRNSRQTQLASRAAVQRDVQDASNDHLAIRHESTLISRTCQSNKTSEITVNDGDDN